MKFNKLIESACKIIPFLNKGEVDIPDAEVHSIHYDSRTVTKGGLFIAIKGLVTDGHDYIDDAINNGAEVVVAEHYVKGDYPVLLVNDSRKALAVLGSYFYQEPSKSLYVVGVTGTNGKTSITYLLEKMLIEEGFNPGVIGTINIRYSGIEVENKVTTPESLDIQRIMHDMKNAGVTHVIMEVSSHAIDLSRIYNCHFNIGIFTNLTQDHLDYHKTMGAYFETKKRFFSEYLEKESGTAIVNCKDENGKKLYDSYTGRKVGTGLLDSTVFPLDVSIDITGIDGTLSAYERDIVFHSPVTGEYNLENIMNAVAAGFEMNLSESSILKGVKAFKVPGRLESIENAKGINAFVDYAHTPDALFNVLKTLKPLTKGKLITVFGCGGDRDKSKRPEMGKIALKFSDLTIVTSDNPRTENPDEIIADILKGIDTSVLRSEEDFYKLTGVKDCTAVRDRRAAIKLTASIAEADDVIILAGKGHETYQILKNEVIQFDDRVELKNALEENYEF